MELHHIVQAKDGGPYTFENAIPLCFDCHAEAGHYNVQHPKGSRFTPTELRGHRDAWYAKMKGYDVPVTTPEHIALDRTTYLRIKRLLPPKGGVAFVRQNNFAGFSFPLSALKDLQEYYYDNADDPSFEFLDPILESLRVELFSSTDRFLDLIGTNTFPTHLSGRNTVPPEWEEENPDRFWKVVNDLHRTAKSFCAAYDELVKQGRRKLAVD